MRKFTHVALGLSVMVAAAGLVSAAPDKRASPHEQATVTIGGKKITIEYGRPAKKGREIFGGLVPWGEVWRTGADEATTITTETNITIGTLKVPKGKYSLFAIPTDKAKEWPLVINKEPKQWGSFKYDQKQDVGRTMLKVEAAPAPVEQFTIALEPQADKKSALLKLSWDNSVASVPVTVQ
jgi:hypothetical protein